MTGQSNNTNDNDFLKQTNATLLQGFDLPTRWLRSEKISRMALIDTGVSAQNPYFSQKALEMIGDRTDWAWHGTAVAGMIAMSVTRPIVLHSYNAVQNGRVQSETVLQLIEAALQDGAQLINVAMNALLDLRTPRGLKLWQQWEHVVSLTQQAGAQLIVSVGNNGLDLDQIASLKLCPAMLPGVLTVGTAETLYANQGKAVDITAPGGTDQLPLITTRSLDYAEYAPSSIRGLPPIFMRSYGTSLAAGLVTGLLLS